MAASFGQMWLPEGGVAANVRVAEQREMIALLRQALLDATGETDIVYAYAKRKEPLARVADAEHARAVAVATLSEQLDAANARVAVLEAECLAWRAAWDGREQAEPDYVYRNYEDPDHAHDREGYWDDEDGPCESCQRFIAVRNARAATGKIGGVA
jgi:hypothetical protein